MMRTGGSSTRLPFADGFSGRKVLVTGHTGFKGSWLSLWLHELGAVVSGFALDPPTQPNNFEQSRIGELLAHEFRADIRDLDALSKALDAAQPDVVLHLAAQTVVRAGYLDPMGTFSANVMGTASVLEGIRQRGKPCAVVVVTTDKCYANDESGRLFTERDPLGGDDPYSASKAGTELVVHAYRQSFFPPEELDRHGVAVSTARAGNVIGGGDWTPDGLIADVMRSLGQGHTVAIRNPDAVRPWQHVLEPLAGYLTLANELLGPRAAERSTAWNFGPDEDAFDTVAQVVDRLVKSWGRGAWAVSREEKAPHEAHLLRLSSEKARRELGWHSRWNLTEAVERIAAWYRCYDADPRSAREACLADITAYSDGQIARSSHDASATDAKSGS